MDISNYNPRAGMKQLKHHLTVIENLRDSLEIKDKYQKARINNLKFARRNALIIIQDLKQYKREYPESYNQLVNS